MIARCRTTPTKSKHQIQMRARYSARGIRVCRRWLSFPNFLADMGVPAPGMSLDRIDNDRGYSPGNCRWATREEQQSNRSVNVMLTFRGETMTQAQWQRRIRVSNGRIRERLAKGWSIERTLTTYGTARR